MANYNLLMVEELTGDDHEFKQTLVQAFIDEIPSDLNALIEAVENENPALTYQVTHKMKPNLQLFGLELNSEIDALENWENNRSKKEEVLHLAKKIETKVVSALEDLRKDFSIQ